MSDFKIWIDKNYEAYTSCAVEDRDELVFESLQAEIERLKAHLASASCPQGCFPGDDGRYLSDGSFSPCDWCAKRKSYIKEQGE